MPLHEPTAPSWSCSRCSSRAHASSALDLAGRVTARRPGRERLAAAGRRLLGHGAGGLDHAFVGMLAFRLPVPIGYELGPVPCSGAASRRRLDAGAARGQSPRAWACRPSPWAPCRCAGNRRDALYRAWPRSRSPPPCASIPLRDRPPSPSPWSPRSPGSAWPIGSAWTRPPLAPVARRARGAWSWAWQSAGMHYTGMAARPLRHAGSHRTPGGRLLATRQLAIGVTFGARLILAPGLLARPGRTVGAGRSTPRLAERQQQSQGSRPSVNRRAASPKACNNLLTAILGNAAFVLASTPAGDPRRGRTCARSSGPPSARRS